jgi:predicted aspartyl protease
MIFVAGVPVGQVSGGLQKKVAALNGEPFQSMNISEICTSIEKSLTRNLRLAVHDEERQQYHHQALQGIAEKVVPALDRLFIEKGEGSQELEKARTVALDLASFVCIGFIRTCTNYSWGISRIEEVASSCQDPQLKKKLVSYTNQLKKRWNIAEPGGLSHNPRAKHIRRQSNHPDMLKNFLLLTILLGCLTFFVLHIDFASLVFPGWNEPQQTAVSSTTHQEHQTETRVPETQVIPEAPSRPVESSVGHFYSFTDKQGVVHIVNDPDRVPPEAKAGMKVTRAGVSRGNVTPVTIKDNQVLVPVTVSLRGQSVDALFLLDTGASVTVISEVLASRLGVVASEVKAGRTTIADGSVVASHLFQADSLAVGSRSQPNAQVSIISRRVSEGYDGLLGMNFLKNFRYHVDFGRSVIEWGG